MKEGRGKKWESVKIAGLQNNDTLQIWSDWKWEC
jgi:hypothetical protein